MLKDEIINYAKGLGFDLVKFTIASVNSASVKAFHSWLSNKYQADMKWMENSKRDDFLQIVPSAKSVICLATNYYRKQVDLKPYEGRVARYAYGKDYHKIITKRLKKLEAFILEKAKDQGIKAYVDTGPVLERGLAMQAGIGNIGKNSCLITKEFGSWVFLSEMITTLELEPDIVYEEHANTLFSVCGSCTACIDACPTGAIVAPGVVDSSKCISYLTIENKGEIPLKFRKLISKTKRLYGCDICQEVCPRNKEDAKETSSFREPIAGDALNLKEMSIISEQDFKEKFAGSAVMRAKQKGMKRNAEVLLSLY